VYAIPYPTESGICREEKVMLRFFLLLHFACPVLARADVVARAVVGDSFSYSGGPVKVLLLDADQTVRISTSQHRAPRSPAEVVLLPGVKEKIAEYESRGFFVAILSNQVNAVGDTGLEQIDQTMQETVRQIQRDGPSVHYYDFSRVAEESKPAPLMIDRLEENLRARFGPGASIDRAHSLMVGDAAYLETEIRPDGRMGFDTANFDRKFAENGRIPFEEPQNFFGWKKFGVERIENLSALESYRKRVRGDCAALFGTAVPQ
jgi:histidinol phosphatase-like enzyme